MGKKEQKLSFWAITYKYEGSYKTNNWIIQAPYYIRTDQVEKFLALGEGFSVTIRSLWSESIIMGFMNKQIPIYDFMKIQNLDRSQIKQVFLVDEPNPLRNTTKTIDYNYPEKRKALGLLDRTIEKQKEEGISFEQANQETNKERVVKALELRQRFYEEREDAEEF